MRTETCRIKSTGRRLRYEHAPDGLVRLTAKEGLRIFKLKTDRDPRTDLFLQMQLALLQRGLNEEEAASLQHRSRRRLVYDPNAADLTGFEEVPNTRGRPPLAPEIVDAVTALVDELGSANAALLLVLAKLDGHPAFLVGKAPRPRELWDLRVLLRRLEKRLNQIKQKHRRDLGAAEAS